MTVSFRIENRIVHALAFAAARWFFSFQMMKEELSRDGEYTRAFHPLRLGGSASMLAYVHPEWTGDLVEIGTIEEGMRESVNESECDLVARRFQGLVQQDTLPMGH
jgi:hypothetical protein